MGMDSLLQTRTLAILQPSHLFPVKFVETKHLDITMELLPVRAVRLVLQINDKFFLAFRMKLISRGVKQELSLNQEVNLQFMSSGVNVKQSLHRMIVILSLTYYNSFPFLDLQFPFPVWL